MLPTPYRLREQVVALARQMDWFRGLRAAVALCAPLALGDLVGVTSLGWAALGGFEAILADTGGSYRSRMGSLVTLSLGGAAGLFIGSIAGSQLAYALPVTILFCFLWSYLAVLGQPFSTAGLLVQVIFICGIGAPTRDWHEALHHALLLLAGGAWGALLCLLLWPLDAYRPARLAVSACFEELASFLNSLAELAARAELDSALWHRLARHHQYRIRRAVEEAWVAIASMRAERQAETAQGYHLVVLLEHADLLIARTITIAEQLEARTSSTGRALTDVPLASLAQLSSAERFIATRLSASRLTRRSLDEAAPVRANLRQLAASLAAVPYPANSADRFLSAQITQAASILDTAIESATLLRTGSTAASGPLLPIPGSANQPAYVYARLAELRQSWNRTWITDQLTANLTPSSLLLRHAMRVALVCGVDVAIIQMLNVNHGYWLLLTSIIVLQPHVSGTMRRGLERVGGTVAGGIFAALLAVALHSQLATAAVLFPLAMLAVAILPVSYAVYAFFLTPAFVLAWLPRSGDWQLALIRIANTAAGAVLSLLAMTFLFPIYERARAPQFLRASLAADRLYLAQLAQAWQSGARATRLLANGRRAAGLAHNDTEESLERLLAESWPHRWLFRPPAREGPAQPGFGQFVAAFVTYLRRFAQSITTLAAFEGESDWKRSPAVQARLQLLDRRLQWMEEGLTPQFDPQSHPHPWLESSPVSAPVASRFADHPGERILERLERQAEVLHGQLQSLRDRGWLAANR